VVGVFIAVGFYLVLTTGSRGALLGMVACLLYGFVRGSSRQRFAAVLVVLTAAIGLFASLFSWSSSRFATLFADSSLATTNEAVGSKATRMYLLEKSIDFTLRHPLLGLGPGEFGDTEGYMARAAGYRGAWQATHNAYTEVSSEAGIPALLCLLGVLVVTARALRKALLQARLHHDNEIASALFYVSADLACMLVVFFFLAMGFRVYLPAITGIGVALASGAQREIARRVAREVPSSSQLRVRQPLAV
jgi:O-antigen ligase